MLENPRLTLFVLQLNQVALYPVSLTNLPAKTHSIKEVALDIWPIKANHSKHASSHAVKLSP
jgi:hypothetical protein